MSTAAMYTSLPTQTKTMAVSVVLAALALTVKAFPSGAPGYTCVKMRPSHPFREQVYDPFTFPYDIQLSPNPAMPGDRVTVTVSSKDGVERFNGLLSTAVDSNKTLLDGFLISPGDDLQLRDCMTQRGTVNGGGVTHVQRLDVTTKSFQWQVPKTAVVGQEYTIRVTVVQRVHMYWVGVNTTLLIGPPVRTNSQSIPSSNAGNTSPQGAGNSSPQGAGNSSPQGAGTGNTPTQNRLPGTNVAGQNQARPGSSSQNAASTNLVNQELGSSSGDKTNDSQRRAGNRGRGRGRNNPPMAAWLSGWFGR